MAYSPPQLSDLQSSIAEDLRDPDHNIFTTGHLTTFANAGIAELNIIRPLETKVEVTEEAELATTGLDYIFLVECVRESDGAQIAIPANTGESHWRTGWDFFAGALVLDPVWLAKMNAGWGAATHTLWVWGYVSRDPLVSGTDIAQFASIEEEMAARRFAILTGYRELQSDRALYQQWQQQANNSDISETQIANMVAYTETYYQRLAKALYRPRRPVVLG